MPSDDDQSPAVGRWKRKAHSTRQDPLALVSFVSLFESILQSVLSSNHRLTLIPWADAQSKAPCELSDDVRLGLLLRVNQ
jgi:hypothetical protein